ncbi:MAG: sigma-70 family RNA polymerase sigma factor [Phycisphaerales bacterium]|nr:sigma-70 family RNA polymerase sigma factor [Phycisphaerales bacterium]
MQPQSEFEDASMTSTTLLAGVAVAGDEAAARAFVARYAPMVRAVARACRLSEADADDVGQEVMVAAVEALRGERYDRARGRFRMFLRGVIAHKVRDLIARNARARRGPAFHTPPDENLGESRRENLDENLGESRSENLDENPGESRSENLDENPGEIPGESRLRGADVPGSAPPCPGSASRLFSPGGMPSRNLDEVPDSQPSPAEAFEAAFDAEWRKVAAEEAMDTVRREFEPSTFQAFDLCMRKNMPPREVASLLGISRNAVYLAKGRVVARLKELLDSGETEEGAAEQGPAPRSKA